MGLDKVALRQVITVAKNSSRLKKSITDMENKVIDSGLELIEKAGIDPNTLPIDVRSVLRGEAPTIDSSKLLTPEIICAQPKYSSRYSYNYKIISITNFIPPRCWGTFICT